MTTEGMKIEEEKTVMIEVKKEDTIMIDKVHKDTFHRRDCERGNRQESKSTSSMG